ncbi:MAG: TetR/AcrR family transcriptional regulator [Thermoanaerobaculia bacterium]
MTLAKAATDTKTSLLDAGEQLFAEFGINGASMRAITRAAGANLAAVHYHFGSKAGLVRAVFRRRLEPLNRERIEQLDELAATGRERDIEGIVEAFVGPPLRMIDSEPGGRAFAQLLARAVQEPGAGSRELVLEQFRGVIERFSAALHQALPSLSRQEVLWRLHFMVGSLSFTAGLGFLVERFAGAPSPADDPASVIARLVSFLTGGMERPPTPPGGSA